MFNVLIISLVDLPANFILIAFSFISAGYITMIDSLDITLNSLREEMSESKKDRMSLREKQNDHDKEIALLKREDKAIWKYVTEKNEKEVK
ncbi:hypothetical protein [Listeria monocytogenes]|uniref:hypothetical protein n=1 Tax=Listeria monocytogenes TaxID=1639 RepID=UPI001BAEFEAB|nr:hypothetical protein [Listeria monocytogenes]